MNNVIRILFLGDVVGRPARQAITKFLAENQTKFLWDIVIVNADNLAHGKGVTVNTVQEMLQNGVDIITGGDHSWDNVQISDVLADTSLSLVVPANIEGYYNNGWLQVTVRGVEIVVINLLGRVFMSREAGSPFVVVDKILQQYDKRKVCIVDFHTEATSEKLALGYYLNGRVSAVIGTHTHIQTADATILNQGTAYISDVGMVGVRDSILGASKDVVLKHFLTEETFKYQLAEGGEVLLCGVLLDIDIESGKALKITTLQESVFI